VVRRRYTESISAETKCRREERRHRYPIPCRAPYLWFISSNRNNALPALAREKCTCRCTPRSAGADEPLHHPTIETQEARAGSWVGQVVSCKMMVTCLDRRACSSNQDYLGAMRSRIHVQVRSPCNKGRGGGLMVQFDGLKRLLERVAQTRSLMRLTC
jgi:hypothetical protein